ncbi:MAG: DUF5990 family protein [Blastocatellia bacterium]
MKHEIPFRIVVNKPLSGVVMKVQQGRDELLPPSVVSEGAISFDFEITADLSGSGPNFLGKYAQGSKDARFIYVNSGQHAGQKDTFWDRRAKLSLMSITKEQIEKVLSSPDSRIEATMNGVGRDGGPTCASVKGIEWKVVKK